MPPPFHFCFTGVAKLKNTTGSVIFCRFTQTIPGITHMIYFRDFYFFQFLNKNQNMSKNLFFGSPGSIKSSFALRRWCLRTDSERNSSHGDPNREKNVPEPWFLGQSWVTTPARIEYFFVFCVLLYFLYVFIYFFCVFKHFFGTASLWRCLRRQKVDEKVFLFSNIFFLINKHFLLLKVSEKTARSWKANNKYHRPVVFTTRWYFLI